MSAWLAPMLAGSVGGQAPQAAVTDIEPKSRPTVMLLVMMRGVGRGRIRLHRQRTQVTADINGPFQLAGDGQGAEGLPATKTSMAA